MSSEISPTSPRPEALLVPLSRTVVPVLDNPVEQARAELKAALAAIEEKANLSKRLARATGRGMKKARSFADANPTAAAAIAVGVAVLAGLAVWGAVRAYTAPIR